MAKTDTPILINMELYSKIVEFACIKGISVEECCTNLIIQSLSELDVIRAIAPLFRKGYIFQNTAFIGQDVKPRYKHLLGNLATAKRVHIRLDYEDWQKVTEVRDSIGCPLNHSLLLLLIYGFPILSVKEVLNL